MLTNHLLSIALVPMAALGAPAENPVWRVYVAANSRDASQGIYLYLLDTATGRLEAQGKVGGAENVSYLALHPSKPFLYGAGEAAEGKISAFRIDDPTGKLTLVNQGSVGGSGPCHVAVSGSGTRVAAANYSAGSVALLPLKEDGSIGEPGAFASHTGKSVNPARQEAPHPHFVTFLDANGLLLVVDLGLDQVVGYKVSESPAALSRLDHPFGIARPGAGPRHLVVSEDGSNVYVVNELDNTVTFYKFDSAQEQITPVQTVGTLPDDFQGENTTAAIRIHPSGKFLYASNRGHNSIAVFTIDSEGRLTSVGQMLTGGQSPRDFNLDPSGRFLLAANEVTDDIFVFRVNEQDGTLEPTGQRMSVPNPQCVIFDRVR